MMMTVVNRPILVRMGRSVRDRNNRGAGELPPVRDLNRQSCGTGAAPPPCIEDVGERLRLLFESLSASFAEAVEQAAQVFATLAEQLRGLYPDVVIVNDLDRRERAKPHRSAGVLRDRLRAHRPVAPSRASRSARAEADVSGHLRQRADRARRRRPLLAARHRAPRAVPVRRVFQQEPRVQGWHAGESSCERPIRELDQVI